MPTALVKIIAGFVAGALAVAIFHQGMYLILKQLGVPLPGIPWNMAPAPGTPGVPVVLNQMFWGGLWGILFAFVLGAMPRLPGWLNGFIFGCIGPMLLGSWLVVAAIKGQPLLSNFLTDYNPLRLRIGFLLNGVAYGIGVGLIYSIFAYTFWRTGEPQD